MQTLTSLPRPTPQVPWLKRYQTEIQLMFIIFVCRRVHISDATLSFLDGEFEVEPAFGEKRDEALRIAGLKTYFIGKVLKPVSVYSSYFYQGSN